jgi:RHS repeat-associated protein
MESSIRVTSYGFCFFGISILLCLMSSGAIAQTSNTDGATPAGLSPGAPAGSHSLTGFENVNPYNGNLNVSMPLLPVHGRGGAGYGITLLIEQKWRVEQFAEPIPGQPPVLTPVGQWWGELKPGYGPGVMEGRRGGHGDWYEELYCGSATNASRVYLDMLTRLTFTAADGTEFELRDKLTGGQPTNLTSVSCGSNGNSRGTVFVTADGSAATFISDTAIYDYKWKPMGVNDQFRPSGYLWLRDGTRYRIDNGLVTWMQDRNGNRLSFTYNATRITTATDSLNRQVTFSYAGGSTAYDEISFKGFGGQSRSIKIWKASLGSVLRSGSPQTYAQLFPDFTGASSFTQFNPQKVSAVELPNGRTYQFRYNTYGELARVELPTGGIIEYDWINANTIMTEGVIYRRVSERRVYKDGSTLENKVTYSNPGLGQGVDVKTFDNTGTLLAFSRHYHSGSALDSLSSQDTTPISYPLNLEEGREIQTDVLNTNGTTVLRRVQNTWSANGTMGGQPVNPRLSETVQTIEPAGANLVAKQTFTHDQYNNQTDSYEYGFGSGVAGALVRRVHIDYLTINPINGLDYACNPASTCNAGASVNNVTHIRDLPEQRQVFDNVAPTIARARTTFEYDNYATDTNHAALTPRSNISGLCAVVLSATQCDNSNPVAVVKRGNATKVANWLLPGSTQISFYSQYDIAGNVVKVIDARGYATLFEFTDRFGAPDTEAQGNTPPSELGGQTSNAFATKVTNAAGHSSYAQFDYYLGSSVNEEDPNGMVSSGSFNDSLNRPTQIKRAIGTGAENQTTFVYDDMLRIVTTKSDLNTVNDNAVVSKVVYDGLGRTIETRQYEGGTNFIATQQQYDALGRAFKTSNPFRPWQFETAVWTTQLFDALGRIVSVTTPDNAAVSTSYSGNSVTVTDQAGKRRRSIMDALGRLVRVDEPDGNNILDSGGSPVQPTSYGYDVLDNLTDVSQGVQTRTFVYDSLRRLTAATNPESGSVSYGYDANGNLITKVDARSITTTFAYDALNRITSTSYNDNPQTPTVSYFYDSQTLPGGAPTFDPGSSTGRLVAVTYGSGSSAGTYRGYDQLGRVVRQSQRTDSVNYLVEATYFANSALKNQTYPAVPGAGDRRLVSYTNDPAGRLGSLNSFATSYAAGASVSNILYAAHNGLKAETYGNGLIHAIDYNNRLQATQLKLGTSGNPTSAVSLGYNYGTTNNNGNVLTHTYSGGGLSYTQNFGYDSLNRLTTSNENGSTWSQTNGYDRYGNRWIVLGSNQSLYFNTSNNRITGGSYDAAGNLLNDGLHSYTYDAENKVRKVDTVSAYTYDGEGQRVRKLVGEDRRFVYGIGGEPIAEFSGSNGSLFKEYIYGVSGLLATVEPAAVNPSGTRYTTPDHLGSPRVVTSSAGTVTSRHDYMPFGEELGSGVGGRTTVMGFSGTSDGIRQKFTSKERDSETGLDYFGARYFASMQGRFTTADPAMESVNGTNPQSWNRYVYVFNNPLRYIDPLGLWAYSVQYEYYEDGEKKGQVKSAKLVFTKTSEEDDAASLVKQLGYSPGDKGYDKLLKQVGAALGDADSIQSSKLGGNIGSFFGVIETKLRDQKEHSRRNPDAKNGPFDADFQDCSMTACRLAYPAQMAIRGAGGIGNVNFGVDQADEMNGQRPRAPLDALRVRDIIRYGTGDERHFANVIFIGEDGIASIFSRTGVRGRFETLKVNEPRLIQGYGPVTGAFRP